MNTTPKAPELGFDCLLYALDASKLRKITNCYSFAYGAFQTVGSIQTRIDEEGCGAVFNAARIFVVNPEEDAYTDYNHHRG